MAVKNKKIEKNANAEEKILHAARKLFTEKGFHAVTSREIAQEAGINVALLNYYFRSKEQLFKQIMLENTKGFREGIAHLFMDTEMDIFEKFQHVTNLYFQEFSKNPSLPLFVMNQIAKDPSSFLDKENMQSSRNILFDQLNKLIKDKKLKPVHHAHIMLNLMSLIMFPFIVGPAIKTRVGLNDKQYNQLLEDRIKLIPMWMENMFNAEKPNI
ncbi:MAG: TetR/AcrR family transcriptional regulator [Chitinophagaceae bacterium]